MTQFWFILSIVFIILELINPGLFFFLALSLGAMITMLAQWYDIVPTNTYALFFISTTIMFLILKIIVQCLQNKNFVSYSSNMQDLIGTITEITEITSPSTGYVHLNGVDWTIKTDNDATLKVGMLVQIKGIKGCHLQVTPFH